MKLKILSIGIILIMIGCDFVASTDIKETDGAETVASSGFDKVVEIRVALSTYMWCGTYLCVKEALDGYQWRVGNTTYKFTLHEVSDKDIIRGKLTTENYDLFNMPASEPNHFKRSLPLLQNRIWKRNIANFIKNGGGYFGYCGGASIAAEPEKKPKTLSNIIMKRANLGITRIKIMNDDANAPFLSNILFLSQLSGKPESMYSEAYVYYGPHDPNGRFYPIVPVEFDINRDNPIFDDLLEDKRLICWAGGGAYVIPEEEKNNVTILASYPSEEIYENKSWQIHAWKYTGGLRGFLKGFLKARDEGYNIEEALSESDYFATDWEMTDKILEFKRANKPFMTMETYPNENQGRIILCYGHPEFCVYFGGHIEEAEDTENNNLYDGLCYVEGMTPWNQTIEDEATYNWWMVRRHAAWVSKKVPDNDLPPIFGPSQVSDIYPYNQSSCFTIVGNAETTLDEYWGYYYNESLDLYYRYSSDNGTTEPWSDWTLYQTDNDYSDGWSWNFDASLADGPGYYQFYSLRHVQYPYEWTNETAPPGPDAIAQVVQ